MLSFYFTFFWGDTSVFLSEEVLSCSFSLSSDGVNFQGEHEILSTFLNSSIGPGVGVRPELVHSGRLSERDFISSRFYFLLNWQNERVGFLEATSLV